MFKRCFLRCISIWWGGRYQLFFLSFLFWQCKIFLIFYLLVHNISFLEFNKTKRFFYCFTCTFAFICFVFGGWRLNFFFLFSQKPFYFSSKQFHDTPSTSTHHTRPPNPPTKRSLLYVSVNCHNWPQADRRKHHLVATYQASIYIAIVIYWDSHLDLIIVKVTAQASVKHARSYPHIQSKRPMAHSMTSDVGRIVDTEWKPVIMFIQWS